MVKIINCKTLSRIQLLLPFYLHSLSLPLAFISPTACRSDMSTPTLFSRYPRPLRATHESFQSQQAPPPPPVSSYSSSSSTTASSSVPIRSTQKHSHATDPPQNYSPAPKGLPSLISYHSLPLSLSLFL